MGACVKLMLGDSLQMGCRPSKAVNDTEAMHMLSKTDSDYIRQAKGANKMIKKYILPLLIIAALALSACSEANKEATEQINAQASEVKIMFYTAELDSEITLMAGEELELHAIAYSEDQELENAVITWESSDESVLSFTSMDKTTVVLKALKKADDPVKIKASCGSAEKELTVHIREQIK